MVKATDFKFDRERLDMTLKTVQKGSMARVTSPLNFWALMLTTQKWLKLRT